MHKNLASTVEDIAELEEALRHEPALGAYLALLPKAFIYASDSIFDSRSLNQLKAFEAAGEQMIILRDALTGRSAISVFEVTEHHSSACPVAIDVVTVQIKVFSFVTSVEGLLYCLHVISPSEHGSLEYQHLFIRQADHIIQTTDIDVSGVLGRFPGQAENILDQITNVASVLLAEQPKGEVKA